MIKFKLKISLTNCIGLVLGVCLIIFGEFVITLLGVACIVGVAASLNDVNKDTEAFIDIDTSRK